MAKGWKQMDTNEKLNAVRNQLDAIADENDELRRRLAALVDHVDGNLRSLVERVATLEAKTTRKS